MDPNTKNTALGAAGAGAAAGLGIEDVFSTYLYDGNNTARSITNGIDLSGEGGLTWIKARNYSDLHYLYDTERGATKSLASDFGYAEQNRTTTLTSFNSDGFSLGTDNDTNSSTREFVSWTFRKAPGFFDVVTWTGDGTSSRNISHALGSTPGAIFVKRTDSSQDWLVWHRSTGLNQLALNQADEAGYWWYNNVKNVGSTTFEIDANINSSSSTYVAYLFAHDEAIFGENADQSVIKCGSFTPGSGTGFATVNLGWEPQWILTKNTASTIYPYNGWSIYDSMRGMVVGGNDPVLYANLSDAELTTLQRFNINATGFESINEVGGDTYIYIAIRRGPMKTPTDATEVFDADIDNAGSSLISTGFPVDLTFFKNRDNAIKHYWADRLRGSTTSLFRYLSSDSTAAEVTFNGAGVGFESNVGLQNAWTSGPSSTAFYNFRRAPGFFDVVAYTGTGVARTVDHNLGVVPELIITKSRSNINDWYTYAAPLGNTKALQLNQTYAGYTTSATWNNTSPTSSIFTVGTDISASSTTYVAYLFATLPGISKVGSYTGSSSDVHVDCGFTAGARFVLIKRTDAIGDWCVFDTSRGIVSGNDPKLTLNSTSAEDTGNDLIDPLSTGFTVVGGNTFVNGAGRSYIFLAIA